MKSSLNAGTLSPSLSFGQFVQIAGAAGFAGVEVRLPATAQLVKERGLDAVKDLFVSAGVTPALTGVGPSLFATDVEFADGLSQMGKQCALAASLGIRMAMLVLPFRRGRGEEDPLKLASKIRTHAEIAGRHGLSVVLEFIGLHVPPEEQGNFVTTLGQTLDLIGRVDRLNVGALIDSYHWYLGGSRLEDLDRVPAGMPLFIHINDAPPGAVESLTDPMRILPGAGVIGLPAWLREIRDRTGYDGFVSIELFNEEIRALEPREAARRCQAALAAVLARV